MRPTLTLCTYTYNDAPFMDGLLAALPGQDRPPDEVLVIDDGSGIPYFMPETNLPARLIRFEENRGNTFVRTFAINEAKGRAVACMDCDIRLSDNWLEACLARLSEPGVGLVSGTLTQSGDDPVSRYLNLFGDRFTRTGPVDFIPGGCWMISKAVWDEVGGFGDHAEPIRQDNALCASLRRRGYRLMVEPGASAVQIREMTRAAAAAKLWRRFDVKIKEALPQVPEHDFPRFFHDSLGVFMLRRTARLVEGRLPELFYMELLYMAHMLLDLLGHAEASGLYRPGRPAVLTGRLMELLAPYPKLTRMLTADLKSLGYETTPGNADHDYWSALFDSLEHLERTGIFRLVEEQGLAAFGTGSAV